MLDLRTLILAAGKGTRMKSQKAKVLHQVGGAALIQHVVAAAQTLNPDVSIVVGHQAEKVRELFPEARFVEQTEQHGTGHAVMQAKDHLAGYTGDLLVLPGDMPLIDAETLQRFAAFHRDGGYTASILTAEVDKPFGYGRIVRNGNSEVASVVEQRDATPEILQISEINSSIYIFNTPALFEALSQVRNSNAQGEYYLTDVIGILVSGKKKVGAFKVPKAADMPGRFGINTRAELGAIDRLIRRQKCELLMAEGVTIVDPDSTFIDAAVQIGADTVIYPSVQIYGQSVIGEDCTIHSFGRITNSKIGNRADILEGCIIVDSSIGDDTSIGPFAHLRPKTRLGDKVKIGNFVETKNSSLDTGSKASHLSYLGDATIGKKVNIGAGTITCNYDGVKKYPTIIEDGVFIGSDSQLIAPVRIGKDAYVGAGSSITEDVPPESLAIARGRQVVKDGWVRDKKKK